MKKITIKRIEISSLAKFVGAVNAVIAVAVGIIASFAGIISIITANDHSGLEAFGISIAVLVAGILVYPLIMFFLGWLYGAVAALIFNLFTGVSGGITIETVEEK